jgi:hypothetical protein
MSVIIIIVTIIIIIIIIIIITSSLWSHLCLEPVDQFHRFSFSAMRRSILSRMYESMIGCSLASHAPACNAHAKHQLLTFFVTLSLRTQNTYC